MGKLLQKTLQSIDHFFERFFSQTLNRFSFVNPEKLYSRAIVLLLLSILFLNILLFASSNDKISNIISSLISTCFDVIVFLFGLGFIELKRKERNDKVKIYFLVHQHIVSTLTPLSTVFFLSQCRLENKYQKKPTLGLNLDMCLYLEENFNEIFTSKHDIYDIDRIIEGLKTNPLDKKFSEKFAGDYEHFNIHLALFWYHESIDNLIVAKDSNEKIKNLRNVISSLYKVFKAVDIEFLREQKQSK